MAKRSESTSKVIEDLNKQIHDLKTRNHELTAELNKMRHAKKSPEESYEAARLRDQKHLRQINKFQTAGYYVFIGGILALLSSFLLFAQISIRYAGQYEWTNVRLNYNLGESSHRFGDPRIGSMAIGSLGLIMSIVGQMISQISYYLMDMMNH
jgi:hypothetical protein